MNRHGILKTALLGAFVTTALSPLAADVLPHGQLVFDPTPSLSAKPALDVSLSLVTKDGSTYCNTQGWCLIPRMPVLGQTDPVVVKALTDALTSYVKATYPNTPLTWTNIDDGKSHTLAEAAALEAGVGCALTAETMLVEAMLARAPRNAVPTGKAKAYVDSNLAPSLSREQSRLVWQYLEHLIAMRKGQVDGPGLLLAPETAVMLDNWNITPTSLYTGSDGGPDDMEAVKADFTKYSMASFAEDMRHTGLTRINFHWSKIGILNTADGVTHIIRADVGQHKIALRGYSKTIADQPGTYPILANDPGSGQLVKLRFTTDFTKYKPGMAEMKKIEYDFYDGTTKKLINLGAVNPGWMAMIYEGEEPLTKNKGFMSVGLEKDVQFFKMQFVNGISTTFTGPPPADPNPTRRIAPRQYFPTPRLGPSSGPVERRLNLPALSTGLRTQ